MERKTEREEKPAEDYKRKGAWIALA